MWPSESTFCDQSIFQSSSGSLLLTATCCDRAILRLLMTETLVRLLALWAFFQDKMSAINLQKTSQLAVDVILLFCVCPTMLWSGGSQRLKRISMNWLFPGQPIMALVISWVSSISPSLLSNEETHARDVWFGFWLHRFLTAWFWTVTLTPYM